MFDKFHEECGVFAIYGHQEAANMANLGIFALQHRGQESAGIASADGAALQTLPPMLARFWIWWLPIIRPASTIAG